MEEIIIIEQVEPEEIVTLEEKIEYVAPSTQEKKVTPTEQEQIVKPDEGVFALSKVTVNPIPSEYIKPECAIEVETFTSTGYPENIKFYGEEIPNGFLRYFNYSNASNVILSRAKNITRIGTSSFQNANVNLSNDLLDEVLYVGEYGMAINRTDTTSISMPKWNGKDIDGTSKGSVFRINNSMLDYFLPKLQYIGAFLWYQRSGNLTIQIGSIGYGVIQCDQRPFGGTRGTSQITCYTTGDKLDTISTAIINQAGANMHFTFKASEDTTYQGVNYQAGETMLTI